MDQPVPELEQRLTELRAQIDRLSLSLHLWRETQDHLTPMERRVTELTDHCAEILDTWTATGQRHAHAVEELEHRLGSLRAVEERLQRDASTRIEDLGRVIEHEMRELRHIHDEPVKQLREQASSLTEVCIATASTAQSGFDRAEASLASMQADFSRRMMDLSRELQKALAELRPHGNGHSSALPAASPQSWPLEGVMRLHSQLRQADDPVGGVAKDVPQLPEAAASLAERVDTLERALAGGQAEMLDVAARSERAGRSRQAVVALLVVGLVAAGIFAWRFERQAGEASAKLSEVQRQTQAAMNAASQRMAETRQDAAREVAKARDAAVKAETISDVLAAPDLARYRSVGGTETSRFTAQALWSRSRGFVFSASRLPPVPANSTYQIWLLTIREAFSAGTFVPDSSGRATVTTPTPPTIPSPVTGVIVTVEPSGGREVPTGATILARASLPPSPPQP